LVVVGFKKSYLLIFLAIIVAALIFQNRIIDIYNDLKYKVSQQKSIDTVENKKNIDPENNNLLDTEKSDDYFLKNELETEGNKDRIRENITNLSGNSETKNIADTSNLKSELTSALKQIVYLNQRIDQFEPGGSSYKEEFYKEKGNKLDSIKIVIDSLSDEIKRISQVNKDEVVKIHDYDNAFKISDPIQNSLIELRKELKTITETN